MASVFQSLFGGGNQAPDYGQAIGAIQSGENQAGGYLSQPLYNMYSSPYDTGLLSMLQGGGANGLSPMLQPSYNYGMQQIGQQTNQNAANAMSGAQARGLGGSSIQQQGVNAANMGGQMSQSSLLAALLGQQFGMQGQAAGQLAGQGSQMAGMSQQQQQALANLYMSGSQDIASLYGQQANANTAASNANNSMWGNMISGLGQAGLMGYLGYQMGGSGGGGGLSGGGYAAGVGPGGVVDTSTVVGYGGL